MAGQIPGLRLCEVISIDDEQGGDRIKVRLIPEDNNKTSIDQFDYAFPLLPKFLYVKPKIGECVYILTAIADDGNSQRFYIGPIVSQLTHLTKEPYYADALSMIRGNVKTPDMNPEMIPETEGVFPESTDIAIMGRKNCDIQIKEDDIRIRAGVKVANKSNSRDVSFNTKDPAYIKLKYYKDNDAAEDAYKSTAVVVADKIALIGNRSKEYYKTTDRKDLITDDEMKKILEKAHALPYGDVLVEFLEMFRTAFNNHVHAFSTMPPCVDNNIINLNAVNLSDMLSDTTKIN